MKNELIWILSDFRQGRLDLSETVVKIQRLYAEALDLVHPHDVIKELDAIEKRKNESRFFRQKQKVH